MSISVLMTRRYQTRCEMTKKICLDNKPISAFERSRRVSNISRQRRKTIQVTKIQLIEDTETVFAKVMGMTSKRYFEREATSIATLGRNELTRRIRNFRGRFKLDFTEDYLGRLSVDRLRHILLAAVMNAGQHN